MKFTHIILHHNTSHSIIIYDDSLGRISLYLFFFSAPGGISDIDTRLEGMDWREEENERGNENEIRGREMVRVQVGGTIIAQSERLFRGFVNIVVMLQHVFIATTTHTYKACEKHIWYMVYILAHNVFSFHLTLYSLRRVAGFWRRFSISTGDSG